MRRTRSQTGSLRDQQANHNQQQRPGRRRRASQSTVQLAESTEQLAYPVEPPSIPLRRSARLNPGSAQSLTNRAVEAEASRLQSRRRIRLRETRNTHNSAHTPDHTDPPTPTIIDEQDMAGRFNNAHSLDGSGRSYSLQVAIQPPRIARVGAPMYPPLAVRVHICDAETGEEISGEDELNNLFAQATLYGENINSPPLAPPDMFLLSGRLSMSLDLLNDTPGESDEDAAPLSRQLGSYVIFPDLVINRAGHYRLGVSLFKVGSSRRGRSSEDPHGGGTSLEEAKSNVIIVQEDSAPIEIDPEEQQFLEHIRDRGVMIPSPPST